MNHMRVLVLDSDYPSFLKWLYGHHSGLERRPFSEQQRVLSEACFGIAGFYASNFRALGHDAQDLHINNEVMQKKWAREHGLQLEPDWRWEFRLRRRIVPWVYRIRQHRWPCEILAAQIRQCKPDLLLNLDVVGLPGRFIREIKPYVGCMIGQHAATPLPETGDYTGYDMIISSFAPTVAWCQKRGIRARLSRLAFEPTILSSLPPCRKEFDIAFIGNLFTVHRSRLIWLEEIARHFPQLRIWLPAHEELPEDSPLKRHYVGSAWGRDMFQLLRSSKIVLNHHGDVPPYANNLRLFEATGVGTCLLTDWKPNLGELFEVGKEVLAFRSVEECLDLIRYYLEHEEERECIARAGQARTLREHTYSQRIQDLIGEIEKFL